MAETQWMGSMEDRMSAVEKDTKLIPGQLNLILYQVEQARGDHQNISNKVDEIQRKQDAIGTDVLILKIAASAAEKQTDTTTQKRDGTKLAAWGAIFLVIAEYIGKALEWIAGPKPPTH